MEKCKVLLVDDEEIICKAYSLELEAGGFYVEAVTSGAAAIESIRKNRFNIVLLDLTLPDMDGVEVCRAIKEVEPHTQVLLFSGHPLNVEQKQIDFIKAGGRDELLRKPLLDNELLECFNEIWTEMQEGSDSIEQT